MENKKSNKKQEKLEKTKKVIKRKVVKRFKDYYDINCAEIISKKIKKHCNDFNESLFLKNIKEMEDLEFFQRQDLFALSLEKSFPKNYSYTEKIEVFNKILGEELKTDIGMFIYGFWLWPISRFVEKTDSKISASSQNLKISLDFIYQLTKRFTGEFAIRPILETKPEKTLKIIKKWAKDKNVHVRRLSSEALRLKLPWAKQNKVFINYFDECFEILSILKNSKEKFIQKSVGNNLNDLYKIDKNLALKIINSWKKEIETGNMTDSEIKGVNWIIKHGLRSNKIGK